MEERPPIWRAAANVLNNKSRTAYRGGIPAWGLGEVRTNPHRKIWPCYKTVAIAAGLD